ncbi:hypothetical protein MHBO_001501 [Bonamia ostreae]|uniref:Ribosomal protein S14 n=1 Tax=Bonamia ostreae TaxID=126728 RepID=A0ABV2AJR6_9EUKA
MNNRNNFEQMLWENHRKDKLRYEIAVKSLEKTEETHNMGIKKNCIKKRLKRNQRKTITNFLNFVDLSWKIDHLIRYKRFLILQNPNFLINEKGLRRSARSPTRRNNTNKQ